MFSHPNKELKLHLENVQELGLKIFDSKRTVWSNDKEIREMLKIILYYHDFGKATTFFQDYLENPKLSKWLLSKNKNLKSHSLLSAYYVYYLVKERTNNLKLSLIAFLIVNKHHSNLKDFEYESFINYEKILKQVDEINFKYFDIKNGSDIFKNIISEFEQYTSDFDFEDDLEEIIKKLDISDFLMMNYLFSILISADKGEAIYNANNKKFEELIDQKFNKIIIDKNVVDKYKKQKFSKESDSLLNLTRDKIYNEVEQKLLNADLDNNKIFSINVPTGMGKTLTVLNAAFKLSDKLETDYKIIYALPFTSIIDQNYQILDEILGKPSSEILLKHHYLAEKDFKHSDESLTYDISEYLIENWDSKIIVTTFVQLLESIFSNKNRKLKKIHNVVNSIIILDEVQSIPYKYWKLINMVFKEIAKSYNTYIILVTATLPLLFSEEKKEIIELVEFKKTYFENLNRIKINLKYISEKTTMDDFFQIIKNDINDNNLNSYLFIVNTIKSSIKLYEYLLKNYDKRYEIIYLSTNIIPKERMKRINKIKENKKVLVVSTQMIEAGVDIDVNRVYRDMASLDSINQSCGRCNRNNNEGISEVFVVNLVDDNNNEYSKYIYGKILLKSTLDILKEYKIIEESNFLDINNQYYSKITKFKSDDISLKILQYVKELKYKSAFEGEKQFRLIDNTFRTVDVFINIDDKSKKLWNQYMKITEFEIYDRKKAFDKIKSDFLSYVISVPSRYYDGEEGFNLINNDELLNYYETNTGFIRGENSKDYCF